MSSAAIPPEFLPHVSANAIAYQRSGRVISLTRMGWQLLGIWLFLQAGAAVRLRNRVQGGHSNADDHASPRFFPLLVYLAVILLSLWVWCLPFDIASFILETRYGFGTETFAGLLRDGLVSQSLLLLAAPLLWFVYRTYRRCQQRWWMPIWAGSVPMLYVLIVLQPVLISPLFNSYTRMPNSRLRDNIVALASAAGVHDASVFVEDTSARSRHVNAYVTGLGPSARIVINDTALRELPEDQLLAMIGHELGHYVERHVMIGYICGVLGSGFFLWSCSMALRWIISKKPQWGVERLNDLAVLPIALLYMSLFLIAQSPFESAVSRTFEHRADVFGLRLTHLNAATARLMVGFAERDYVDPNPPELLHLWFGSHPTIDERIAFALSYRP